MYADQMAREGRSRLQRGNDSLEAKTIKRLDIQAKKGYKSSIS